MAGTVRIKVRGGKNEHGWEDINLSESFGSCEINQMFYSDLRSKRKIVKSLKGRLLFLIDSIIFCKEEVQKYKEYRDWESASFYADYADIHKDEAERIIDFLIDLGESDYIRDIYTNRKEVV